MGYVMFQKGENSPADQLVGRNIAKRRLDKRITKSELAQNLGCSVDDIDSVESGKLRPTADTIYKIAIILECEISHLFSD